MQNTVPSLVKTAFLAALALTLSPVCGFAQQALPDESLNEGDFLNPPNSAKVWTWWHFLNGHMTKEGITADLEAMKRGGLGGAQMFDVSGKFAFAGPVRYMSPEWLALMKHATTEAQRLGLKLGMHNSSGWSSSGGPWVTPEQSMQILVSSETTVKGPSKFSAVLPQPQTYRDFYRDTAVVAYPIAENCGTKLMELSPKITSNAPDFNPALVFDGKENTGSRLPVPTPETPQYIQLEFANPYTARALSLDAGNLGFYGELQSSDDGKTFRVVRPFYIRGARGKRSFSFPEVTSRYFRIVFQKPDRAYYTSINLVEADLCSELMIDDYEQKAGYQPYPKDPKALKQTAKKEDTVPPGKVIDLTSHMKPGGQLTWAVPEGKWRILRIGHTSLGTDSNYNNPATEAGRGLECNKLDADMVRAFWAGGPAKVLKELGPLAGSTFTDIVIDSYERGQQNWTAKFPQEFEKRRGYSMTKYMPALTGRVVGSIEESERFLWDVRRTISDLFVENYAGTFAELERENKLLFGLEPAGFVAEQLGYLGKAEMPIAVTWISNNPPETYMPASAAHIYGRKLVGGETMTAQPKEDNWKLDPYAVKALGDAVLCSGVNRITFHTFAHQPWLNRAPGMTAGQWGSHFDRNNTWWDQGRDWRIYLARCQYLLQQGMSVADGLYFCGESVPVGMPIKPAMPRGYQYDGCNADVIINRLTVKDGKLMLPHGASYAYLSLGDVKEMTLPVLKKIRELVAAGATVIGPKPKGSPSLQDYPQCDAEMKAIAEELWGDCDGEKVKEHAFGKGSVMWTKNADEVLKKLKVQPDFEFSGPAKKLDIRYIHRKTADADIYFISNQENRFVQTEGTFRVAGKVPQLWRADTGKIEASPLYKETNGRISLPLSFEPRGSVFVIFRKGTADANRIVSASGGKTAEGREPAFTVVQGNGKAELTAREAGTYEIQRANGQTAKVSIESVPQPVEISGAWELKFPPNLGAPEKVNLEKLISWPEHSDPGVKYFSGTATYSKKLTLPKELFGEGRSLYLDLGEVKNLAQVRVNEKDLGIAWKPPYRVEITKAAKAGDNKLEIEITNLWPNRLIGDEQLPPDCEWSGDGALKALPAWFQEGKKSPTGRIGFTTYHHWKKDDKLLPSGLLGPVQVQVTQTKTIPSR